MTTMRIILLILISSFIVKNSEAQNDQYIGTWLGHLKGPLTNLRIALHISEKEGVLLTKLDSPDQFSFGNAANKTTLDQEGIHIDFPLMGAKYVGQMSNDSLVGTFYQNGTETPLNLGRFEGEILPPARPQTPKAPFNYSSKDVVIKTKDDKVKLAGTLTIPEGKGPFPAAILVSGSGPQDRDEYLMGHRPFHVIADYLTRNGIAVLRYDDRGVGKSTGVFATATSFDFADDAEAAHSFLKKQSKIDKTKVGIIGHSEGGLIAPIVASRKSDVGFIILLAGPSVSGRDIIIDQQELIMLASGEDSLEVQKTKQSSIQVMDFIAENHTKENLVDLLATKIEELNKELNAEIPKAYSPKSYARQVAFSFGSAWMKTFILTNPQDYLTKTNCPILALYGEKDLQVSVRANEEQMRKVLDGKEKSEVVVFKNLNHLFQHADLGIPSEYQAIEETISVDVLQKMTSWIKDLMTK